MLMKVELNLCGKWNKYVGDKAIGSLPLFESAKELKRSKITVILQRSPYDLLSPNVTKLPYPEFQSVNKRILGKCIFLYPYRQSPSLSFIW